MWNSRLQHAMFYIYETWLTIELRIAETIYMFTLKQLFGVWLMTYNDIAVVEARVGNANSYITNHQGRVIQWSVARDRFHDTSVCKVFTMVVEARCFASLVLHNLPNFVQKLWLWCKLPDYNSDCIQKSNINL